MPPKQELYMKKRESILAVLQEDFVAGVDEDLSPIMHHLWKLEGGAIYFCRSGWAHATIDLKDYEIVKYPSSALAGNHYPHQRHQQ